LRTSPPLLALLLLGASTRVACSDGTSPSADAVDVDITEVADTVEDSDPADSTPLGDATEDVADDTVRADTAVADDTLPGDTVVATDTHAVDTVTVDSVSPADTATAPAITSFTFHGTFAAVDDEADLSDAAFSPRFLCYPSGAAYSVRLNATTASDGAELLSGTCTGLYTTLPPLTSTAGLAADNAISAWDLGDGRQVAGFDFAYQPYAVVLHDLGDLFTLNPRLSSSYLTWTQGSGATVDLVSYRLADGMTTNLTQGQWGVCPHRYDLGDGWLLFGVNAVCTTYLDYYRLDLTSGVVTQFIAKDSVSFGGNERLHAHGAYAWAGRYEADGSYGVYRISTQALGSATLLGTAGTAYYNGLTGVDDAHLVVVDEPLGEDDREVYLMPSSGGAGQWLTADGVDQRGARVSGDYVVWSQDDGDAWSVWLYRISTGARTELSAEHPARHTPALEIAGDHVVFEADTPGDALAYVYTISSGGWRTLYSVPGHTVLLPSERFLSDGQLVLSLVIDGAHALALVDLP